MINAYFFFHMFSIEAYKKQIICYNFLYASIGNIWKKKCSVYPYPCYVELWSEISVYGIFISGNFSLVRVIKSNSKFGISLSLIYGVI